MQIITKRLLGMMLFFSMLLTSGGKAPGPQPLKDCIHNIKKVLDAKEDRMKLKPI